MNKFVKPLIMVCAAAIAAAATIGIWLGVNAFFLKNTVITKEITISKGETLPAIYEDIFGGLDTPPGFKTYIGRVKQLGKRIKYGYYSAENISLEEFLSNIGKGIQSTVKVTIPEGFNIFEIASTLERMGVTGKESFIDDAFNKDVVISVTGEKYDSMEGFLAPGTYKFPKNHDNIMIIKALYSEFRRTFPTDFKEKAAEKGLTEYEALTLASIVQKETYSAVEAPIVASVFHNRLKLKMRLQADPTIIYGKYLDFDGNIHKKDIQDATNIFNTYRHGGLPPTPICNPSATALNAVINPADTNYIYFVADKKGNHLFSSDYRQHVNNVRKYQKQ